ncbi:MAG: DUF4395 domain-containing protein [Leucobacter sp.]
MTDIRDDAQTPVRPQGRIDPRGPRFNAAITSVLLLLGAFLSLIGVSAGGSLAQTSLGQRIADPGFILLLIVAALFAWSLLSPSTQPWSALFRALVQPRLSPPQEWEDPRPPRFAQGVGLVVVGIGLVLHLLAVPWALVIAAAAAFIAAALNATIGFCLGCEIYLLLARIGLIRPKPLPGA